MNIQNYGARPNDGSDTTPAVRDAIREMRSRKAPRLVFPQGRYHFWPQRAEEHYLFVSNNDEGLKRIAFPLFDVSGLEIEGEGSEFIFHGFLVPFALQGCRNVTLRNFSMDWERTFHSEAEVLSTAKEADTGRTRVDLRIPEQFPYRIEHERLEFIGEGAVLPVGNLLEFDPIRRETAFRVSDNYAFAQSHKAKQIEPGFIQLTAEFSTVPTPGNIAVIGGDERLCPGIAVSDSTGIKLVDVTIHHCGGMGVIAQRTTDIALTRVQVTPSEIAGRRRMVSSTADATHFVNCGGLIEMTDCLFENQMDDPTNVHGIYARISQVLSGTEIEVERVHGQQQGIDITQAGDTLEFVSRETLLTYHEAGVAAVERWNKQFSRVTLTAPLPPQVNPSDAIASLSWRPDVMIQGCTARNNRARGFLLSTGGKVLIEDNHFHTPGAAILIAGDANYWFESGAVRDVTIRHNHFDNCNYGVWGRAAIDICPEIAPEHRVGTYFHRNITIENNTFDVFDPRLLHAHCVDGLVFRDNTVRLSTAYPSPTEPAVPLNITDCVNVSPT